MVENLIQDALQPPCVPFEIHTTSGKVVVVKQHDFAMFTETRRTLIVTDQDHVYMVPLNQISLLQKNEPTPSSG